MLDSRPRGCIKPSLVLVQPRKTRKIVDWDIENQSKQTFVGILQVLRFHFF